MPQDGIQSVTVPGCVNGWEKLHKRFGKLTWDELFAPAVYYAEHGFPVTEIIHEYWRNSYSKLSADENGRRIFLRDGAAPAVGEVFRNPAFASALRLIAAGGAGAFYRGAIAKAILATSDRLGGTLASADLSRIRLRVGRADLDRLPRLEGVRTAAQRPGHGDARDAQHHGAIPAVPVLRAQRRASASSHRGAKAGLCRSARYVADPRFAKVPVGGLLSKDYARERAELIDRA